MRELRFRAWDVEWKRWLDPANDLSICGDGMIYGDRRGENGDTIETVDGSVLIVEQYTGIKDKNGRYVYEGDILQASDNSDVDGGLYIVSFSMGEFVAVRESDSVHCGYWSPVEIQVVGNIHSNPEMVIRT